jgi:NADPH-dependent curcumin reductase CurA
VTPLKVNRQLILTSRPVAKVGRGNFELRESSVPAPRPGQFLVRNIWIGFDASLRVRLNAEGLPGYMPPVELGELVRSSAVGQVDESNHPGFRPGDYVRGMFGWQDWAVCGESEVTRIPDGVAPRATLGLYGSTGLTGYFGMLKVGQPAAGETVVVSAAAGATGSIAAQIARLKGCRVIGIAGGPEKCQWLLNVARLDDAIDYREGDLPTQLRARAPSGIDVFFDNVGGATLEAVLDNLAAKRARIVLCGAISRGYNGEVTAGPANYFPNLVLRSARMQGFMLSDYSEEFGTAIDDLRQWVDKGQLVYQEDIQYGIENAPDVLQRLFDGRNIGKQLLEIAEPVLA